MWRKTDLNRFVNGLLQRKRTASQARIEILQAARETFSSKQRRSTTPADSNLLDGNEGSMSDSDDEIVHFNSFKTQYTISQMDKNSDEDIPNAHTAIQVIEQSDVAH